MCKPKFAGPSPACLGDFIQQAAACLCNGVLPARPERGPAGLFVGAYAYSVASANSTARPNVGQTATAAAAAQAVSRVTACPADLISAYAQVRSASDCWCVDNMRAGMRPIWGWTASLCFNPAPLNLDP